MSDDDLIRDAVHELVAAAPPPKPLPMGGASSGRLVPLARRRRAAVILVIGGIVAIAWSRADDDGDTGCDDSSAATADAATRNGRDERARADEPGDGDCRRHQRRRRPSEHVHDDVDEHHHDDIDHDGAADTGASPVAGVPRRARRGRYDDAALLLREGGLEPERRSDCGHSTRVRRRRRTSRLGSASWCEDVSDLHGAGRAAGRHRRLLDGDMDDDEASLTGYFRSGSFEGSPSVTDCRLGRPPDPPSAVPPTTSNWCARPTSTATEHRKTIVVTRNDGLLRYVRATPP